MAVKVVAFLYLFADLISVLLALILKISAFMPFMS